MNTKYININSCFYYKFEAGVNAPPISFKYRGKQYIAVVAGGNKIMGFPQGDYIALFALDKN